MRRFLMKLQLVIILFLVLLVSPAIAQNGTVMCQGPYTRHCPPAVIYQGKSLPLAAVYYTQAFWREQIPPTVSCNYGANPDGSYKVYKSYVCCMPKPGEIIWHSVSKLRGQFQCVYEN